MSDADSADTGGDGIPTFANNGDRVTYLLGEYRLLVSIMVLGAVAAIAYVRPEIPTIRAPAWLLAYPVALLVFAPVGVPLAFVVVTWLRNRRSVTVYEIDAGRDVVKKWLVAPETWAGKTVDGADPYPINGGDAWGVRRLEYDEDAGLEVEGCWPASVTDVEWYTSQTHIENIHEWLIPRVRELIGVRELASRIGLRVQERLVNKGAEARERGTNLDPQAVSDAVEDVKDDLPTFDEDEMPNLDEALREEDAAFRGLEPAAERVDDPPIPDDPGGVDYE
jgi:hypothetical protein